MQRALFIDRDGIFNEVTVQGTKVLSPRSWKELRRYAGLEDLASAKALGFRLILVTNQPDVERNLLEPGFLEGYHEELKAQYGLDAVYVCPHSSAEHPDKKPNPGMLLQAARDWQLNLRLSFFLGDTERDVLAAQRAGCKSILWDRPYNQHWTSDFRVKHVGELVAILSQTGSG